MASIAIPIESVQRRMRGGSQALLVRTANQSVYIAKCVGNPQGTRTLINEWVVTRLLRFLEVSTPEVHPLQLIRGIEGDDLLNFQIGNRKIPIHDGVHLGSLCPVDPERVAIFDFLPRQLLSKVVNLPDFAIAYVFDRWVGQADTRQAIFTREHSADRKAKFRAYLIDHGFSFGGSRWELSETGLQVLYHDHSIYSGPNIEAECHAAVDRIQQLPDDVLFSDQDIPAEWFAEGDREQMACLMETLGNRRAKLHESVERALRSIREAGGAISKAPSRGLLLTILVTVACLCQLSTFTKPVADVEVTAQRDVDFSEAPENRPLHVVADAYDVTALSLTAEVVNEYGDRVWLGTAALKNERIEASVPAIHKSGVYFFRLYGFKGASNALSREYVLVVKEK